MCPARFIIHSPRPATGQMNPGHKFEVQLFEISSNIISPLTLRFKSDLFPSDFENKMFYTISTSSFVIHIPLIPSLICQCDVEANVLNFTWSYISSRMCENECQLLYLGTPRVYFVRLTNWTRTKTVFSANTTFVQSAYRLTVCLLTAPHMTYICSGT